MKTLSADELRTLKDALPSDAVLTDPVALITYEIDGSLGLGNPDGIVLPRTESEVVIAVNWAARHGVPIVARGAGTGLSGGALASQRGLVLSFARMKQVLETDEVGRSVVVQPGIVHQTLDEYVRTKGLYYPADPASGRSCTLGGNFGENAGGPHCFKYGVTTNYVAGLRAVLADGRLITIGGRATDYPEYDLVGLMVGSEGTLGIITEASLRLMRNIPGVKTLMAIFNSVEEAGEAVAAVIARGLIPGTLEMMDRNMIGIVENFAHAGLPTDAEALLIIEADGYPESLESQMTEIVQVMNERAARELRMAQNAAERDKIWFARKSAFGAIAQISPAYLMVDGTVPRSGLSKALAGVNEICTEQRLRVGYVFHAGDGNLHPLIMFDPRDTEMVERVHEAGRKVMELCVAAGGSITGEHGVGSEKREYMKLMFNADEMHAMKEIKEVFDPGYVLNPGKILPDDIGQKSVTGERHAGSWERGPRVAPQGTQEAVELIREWAALEDAPSIRVRGAGTKSSLLPPAGVMLSTEALCGVTKLALNDLYITAAAGTPLSQIQAELAEHGMWTPLASPWTASTIGGIVASNANAPLRMRYGAIRDLILAQTVVLPDGRLIRAGKEVVKNVAGYDLPKLFTGSRGTLGLITDVTLKIWPLPRARRTVAIPIANLAQGLQVGMKLLRVAMVASSLLLCSGEQLPGFGAPYVIIYTVEGVPEDVAAELGQVKAAVTAAGAAAPVELDVASGTEFWGAWLRNAAPADSTLRTGVAPKDLAQLMVGLAPNLEGKSFIADIPTGMVYARNTDLSAARQSAQKLAGYAVLLSGPDGTNAWGHKPAALDLMQGIKAKWDAQGKFNPGAFIV